MSRVITLLLCWVGIVPFLGLIPASGCAMQHKQNEEKRRLELYWGYPGIASDDLQAVLFYFTNRDTSEDAMWLRGFRIQKARFRDDRGRAALLTGISGEFTKNGWGVGGRVIVPYPDSHEVVGSFTLLLQARYHGQEESATFDVSLMCTREPIGSAWTIDEKNAKCVRVE